MADAGLILRRREQRRDEQVRLLRESGSALVSVTVVSPGPDKDDGPARVVFGEAVSAVESLARARGWVLGPSCRFGGPSGPECLAAVGTPGFELPGLEVKRALVELEDRHPLGRLWDLDVVDGLRDDGQPVVLSRADLGHGPRRCLVCAADARACARSARHPLPLLLAARAALAAGVASDAGAAAADLAVEALLVEARLTPKPGLVDASTNGAHDDMDLALLERSAQLLGPWLAACWQLGAAHPGRVEPLVELGVAAEAAMRVATAGVNTHRGALFSLGLLLGALGARAAEADCATDSGADCSGGGRPGVDGSGADGSGMDGADADLIADLCGRVAELAAPLLSRWRADADPAASHGSAALRDLGVTGARGEATSGFATVVHVGLPAYRARLAAYGDDEDALRWALVRIIAVNADTNLVARGGVAGLEHARGWARGVVARDPSPAGLVDELTAADVDFTTRRLSPGGSADLLALTWLFDRLDRSMGC